MKKPFYILINLLAILSFACLSVSAEGAAASEYIIESAEDGYRLSEANGEGGFVTGSTSLAELLSYLPSEATVIFNDIAVDKPPELPAGTYTFVGSLTVADGVLTVPQETELILDGMSLTFSCEGSGYLRVKGGSVTFCDSSLSGSPSGAVLLDYLPSSHLTLLSGSIASESEVGAVRAEEGTLSLCGGSIKNGSGAAVSTSASVFLSGEPEISGAPYDIITDRPLTLSLGGVAYSSGAELSVSFDALFSKGTLTEVLYSSDGERAAGVRLYDSEGREYGLSHFDSSPYSDEKNFSAVYLPYKVTYYGKGGVFLTTEVLGGEALSAPTPPEVKGYIQSGYYTDRELSRAYSFGEPVTADLSLYAGYRLEPPTLKISSYTAEYDGSTHTLAPDYLTHTLLSEGGFFGYRWYKDGETVSYDESLELCQHSDSGVYSLEVTFYYFSDSVTVRAENISFNINKATLSLPTIQPKYYNGERQSPDLPKSPYYSASSVTALLVGVYPVEFILTDPENYAFSGISERAVSVPFEILKAENCWLLAPTVSDLYEGGEPAPEAYAAFGEAVFSYSLTPLGEYSQALPTGSGARYMIATVAETENYTGLVSAPVEFYVLEERLLGLSVKSSAKKLSYTAFEYFDGTGLVVLATYSGGRVEELTVDDLAVSYQQGDSFLYGDNAVNLGYKGKSCRAAVSVSAAEYALSWLGFADATLVYNGSYRSLTPIGEEIIGKDGYPLIIDISGGGTNVGLYTVTVDFYTQSPNYIIPERQSYTLEITPLVREVLWGNCDFVYDGGAKCPTASFVDVLGVSRPLTVLGAKTDAGDSYLAVAESPSDNYMLLSLERPFVIRRADYDLSGVSFSSTSFVYDGEEKSVYVKNLPEGLVAVGYTDGSATEAGSYTVSVIFSYDERNYNPPKTVSCVWTIHKADYDLSGISFEDSEAVYDGKEHTPTLVGNMPVGADGIPLSYRIEGSARDVSDGSREVRLVFISNSKNYRTPSARVAYVRILPKGVGVVWEIERYVYDGGEHLPTARSGECEIKVTGAATDAGKHTATAAAVSQNYRVVNPEAEFEIFKAENRWITAPAIGDFYSTKSPSPSSAAYYGEALYTYYSDEACTVSAALPLPVGSYYMKACVPESKNYLGLEYNPVAFTVLEVRITELKVSLATDSLTAFSPLTDDTAVLIAVYNDGSEIPLSLASAIVTYNGKALPERGDSEISVSYGGMSVTLPVTVGYADYDLSGAVWQGRVTEYNGLSQSPTLSGLPEGVTVARYEGAERTAAGRYRVTAILAYDEKNYNLPVPLTCEFVINKATAIPSALSEEVYDGAPKLPRSDSPLYTLSYDGEIINAGSYTVKVVLTDTENYRLESDTLCYTVLPRKITVAVGDISRYLGGETDRAEYSITEGSLAACEELAYSQIIRDGRVYLVSDNPNYEIVSLSGRVSERHYPSPRVTRMILLSVFSLALLLLLLLIAYKGRDNLRALCAAASCKWRNRKIKIQPPRVLKQYPESYSAVSDTEPEAPTVEIKEDSDSQVTDESSLAQSSDEAELVSSHIESPDDADLFASHHIDEAMEALSVDMERADELISDSLAKELVKKSREVVITDGYQKGIINVDTLSESFSDGERVDVNVLKSRGLLPDSTAYLKVLARGSIDKALSVYANDFSLSAVKMIALTGGEAIKVVTVKKEGKS